MGVMPESRTSVGIRASDINMSGTGDATGQVVAGSTPAPVTPVGNGSRPRASSPTNAPHARLRRRASSKPRGRSRAGGGTKRARGRARQARGAGAQTSGRCDTRAIAARELEAKREARGARGGCARARAHDHLTTWRARRPRGAAARRRAARARSEEARCACKRQGGAPRTRTARRRAARASVSLEGWRHAPSPGAPRPRSTWLGAELATSSSEGVRLSAELGASRALSPGAAR